MTDGLGVFAKAVTDAGKIVAKATEEANQATQRVVTKQMQDYLETKRKELTTRAKEQVVARKMHSVYEDLRKVLAVMKEHGIAKGKRDQKLVAEMSALERINRDEAEKIWTMARRYKTELMEHEIDVETITRPDVKEEQKAYAKMMEELKTYDLEFHFEIEQARKIAQGMSYNHARTKLAEHIKLPYELNYDEVLLLVQQERLKSILPEPLLIFLEVAGMFSSAKTYMVWIATMLAGGEMIYEPTEAGIYRTLQQREGATLGIDQIDLLMKKAEGIASLLLVSNRWHVPKVLTEKDPELGIVPESINVGGVKFYSLYEAVDKALTSRSLRIDMQRHIDADMIIEFLLGSPLLAPVKAYLMVEAERALKTWTRESVVEHMRSDEFKKQVLKIVESSKLGRDAAVASMILLLGRILGRDVQGIVDRYLKAEPTLREKTEIYKTVMEETKRRLTSAAQGRSVTLKNGKNEHTLTKSEVRLVDGLVEAKSFTAFSVFNDTLRNESVGTGAWGHVLEELGFVKGQNWLRINTRSDPWRDSTVIRFPPTEEATK